MPAQTARVFARLFSFSRPDPTTSAKLSFVVEYMLLDGGRRSDKAELVLDNIEDEAEVHRRLKNALLDHLIAKFPTAGYVKRDIDLWGK